jgi:hypothetical protein
VLTDGDDGQKRGGGDDFGNFRKFRVWVQRFSCEIVLLS